MTFFASFRHTVGSASLLVRGRRPFAWRYPFQATRLMNTKPPKDDTSIIFPADHFEDMVGQLNDTDAKKENLKVRHFSVDRRQLLRVPPQNMKSLLTPLARELKQIIKATGPMPLSVYMRQALSHPDFGYYMRGDVFGKSGDFITSPEVSQLFGEMIGIWCVSVWHQMGKPKALRIVEMGPGRGTLMHDVLRTGKRFSDFWRSVTDVDMIEVSPPLREMQKQKLKTLSGELLSKDGIRWHTQFEDIIHDKPVLIIAHELFDALPIKQFQFTKEKGWCERLVDVDEEEGNHHLKYVLSDGPTPAAKSILRDIIAKGGVEDGAMIEVSPDSCSLAQDLAKTVSKHKGAALAIDYGANHALSDSLRGIIRHSFEHPLCAPGNVDLSAWVDFSALSRAIQSLNDSTVSLHGPVTQTHFLHALGIFERMEALAEKTEDEKKQYDLELEYDRLTEPAQMGHTYKAWAVSKGVTEPLPGFIPAVPEDGNGSSS